MMFLLFFNIGHNGGRIRFADRKAAIATLPSKTRYAVGFYPLRRRRLQMFKDAGDGLCSRQSEERMHVVSNTADNEGRTFEIPENLGQIRVGSGP